MYRVLVVDDDAFSRAALADAFRRCGFETATAENGRVAMMTFRQTAADLVVTEIVMPEQDGLATMMALQRLPDPPKIIAMTGSDRRGSGMYLKWAQKLGADGTLAKPIEPAVLVAMACALMGLAAPLVQLQFDFGERICA